MTNTSDNWTQLTASNFEQWYPAPDSLTASLSEQDAQDCRAAYARHCLSCVEQVADVHGRCPHEVTQCIADHVARIMGELIASGQMRGRLH